MLQKPTLCVLSSHCWQVEGLLKPASKVDPGVLHRESQVDGLMLSQLDSGKDHSRVAIFFVNQRTHPKGHESRGAGLSNVGLEMPAG